MPRFKVEYSSANGAKVTLSIDGAVTPEQISRVMEVISRLSDDRRGMNYVDGEPLTTFGRLTLLLEDLSNDEWMPSSLIRDAYKRRYGEEVKLPVISTYLARLSRMGFVERKGSRNRRLYRAVRQVK